jgi:hypothetical protein
MLRMLSMLAAIAAPLAGQGHHYESSFEALAGSAAGTPVSGQDGFFVPQASPARIDGRIHTYAGNTLGIPQQPLGGSRFLACASSATNAAAAQRLLTVPFECEMHIEFDVCVRWLGAGAPPTIEIGSMSLQPSGAAITAELVARWPAGTTSPPTTWNADVRIGPGAGTVVPVTHPAFQGLPVDVWHRWGATVDMRAGTYGELNLTNGQTGVRTLYPLPPGTAPLCLVGSPLADSFRLESAGAGGTVIAFDRVSFGYHAGYAFYGAGCAGSLGVPSLTLPGNPRPVMSLLFQLALGNLPLDVGIVTMGFSRTSSGPFTLPLDLGSFGLPGCSLLADPAATTFVAGTGGQALWSVLIPNDSLFMGMPFYNQGFALDPGINATGVTASRGGSGCVGR